MRMQKNAASLLKGLTVTIFVLGIAVSSHAIMKVVTDAEEQTPVLFDVGLRPVKVKAPPDWTNESCAQCHKKEYDSWIESRHAKAADNDHFKVELLDEGNRQQYCVNCHAPRTPEHGLLPTEEPHNLDALYAQRPEWLRAGVDCLTCHVRDGKILATKMTSEGEVAHPLRHAPELKEAEFCAGCHQFSMKDPYFPDSSRGHFQQESLDEFLNFRKSGYEVKRCQECHMPDGGHLMPGGYSDQLVRDAVSLNMEAKWNPTRQVIELDVTVEGGYVGHRIPGGESFRFLSIVTLLEDASGQPLYLFERNGGTKTDDGRTIVTRWPHREYLRRNQGAFEKGKLDETPLPDTRLFPEEVRKYRYAFHVNMSRIQQPIRAKAALLYHFMGSSKAKYFHHSPEDVIRIVHSTEQRVELRDSN